MRAGETLISNNHQVSLFPLSYMNISQGEGGSYSHQGSYAMDFLGWDSNGRLLNCPYYAPFDCHVVSHASYYNVWQSDDEVITPRGLQYVSFAVIHDDNPPSLGTYKRQGEIIGHTGTNTSPNGTPVTGDHVHIVGCNGLYTGWINNGHDLANREHLYNLFFINDTVLINPSNYNWVIFNGDIDRKKYKFKWVLYTNKIRERR